MKERIKKILDWISIIIVVLTAWGTYSATLKYLHYNITGRGVVEPVIPTIIFIALSICAIFFILSQHEYKKTAIGFNILLLLLAIPLLLDTIPSWLTSPPPTEGQKVLFSVHRVWLMIFAITTLILSIRETKLWNKVLAIAIHIYTVAAILFGLHLLLSNVQNTPVLVIVTTAVALLLNPIYLLSQTQQMQRTRKRKKICYTLLTISLLMVIVFKIQADTFRGRYFWVVVAQNQDTPRYILIKLAHYENSDKRKQAGIRSAVARNPSTPLNTLEMFADDEDIQVRSGLAINESTPLHILEELAEDKDQYIRYNVARNPNTPTHILREYMKVRYDEHLDTSDKGIWTVFHGIAENPNTPEDILRDLAGHKDSGIRSNVARNPRTPPHILEQLAKNSKKDEIFLRASLYHNKNTPRHVILSEDIGPIIIPE